MTKHRIECINCAGLGLVPIADSKLREICTPCTGLGYTECDNVDVASIATTVKLDADNIMRQTIGKLDDVVILGYTKDGREYYASNMPSGPDALWLLQRNIHQLMHIVDEEQEQ